MELFVKEGVLRQVSGLAELLEVLFNGDFVHWFLELCEEIGIVLGVFAVLRMILMAALRPRSGLRLELDINIGDPEALIKNNLFKFDLCTGNSQWPALFLNYGK